MRLDKASEACTNPLLRLTELRLLRPLVQNVEGVRVTFLLQVVLDLAEFLLELAVQDLVVQDVLEVFPGSSAIKGERAVQLTVLRNRRMVLKLNTELCEQEKAVENKAEVHTC